MNSSSIHFSWTILTSRWYIPPKCRFIYTDINRINIFETQLFFFFTILDKFVYEVDNGQIYYFIFVAINN